MEIVATRSPACCAAVSFSQSYSRPKASRPATTFYGESVRVNTARPLSARQSKAVSRAALITRCEIGDSLEEFLTKATPDKNLIRLLICMGEAMRTIAFKVRTASCGGTACVNSFGDEQLAVDMLANKLLFEALEYSHVCKYACSEEVPELQDMGGPVEGGFSVAFDPLTVPALLTRTSPLEPSSESGPAPPSALPSKVFAADRVALNYYI
ncbi:hypothetical protein BDA96_03G387300 [Sorghum bicolor]|uniref:Fructose-1-6-bisphosphatase class I N-terminal domain-containing protein n=1 Tax=Sorghum bicolor TaxID=4558 RepID=A0A921RGW1_SORBI|nr:hypothetical protein BDA96_03G387300 [Sorghum bicolor]